MRFVNGISFNSRDWKLDNDDSGRIAVVQSKQGIKDRFNRVLKVLGENKNGLTMGELRAGVNAKFAETRSYSSKDLRYALQKLHEHGFICKWSVGTTTLYSLERKAQEKFAKLVSK